MRRAAVAAVLLVLLPAASAQAAAPRAWPGAAIGYRDLTGRHGYHEAVARAVAAWNRLRLGVRFTPAATGSSSVQIVFVPGRCLSGSAGGAPTGFQRFGARVVVRSCPKVVRPLLVAHELGRVLGLDNDDRGCSLMNSKGVSNGLDFAVPAQCAHGPPPAWLRQLVDPRTGALARAMYTAPAPPGTPALVAVEPPRIQWTQPGRTGAAHTVVAREASRCPDALDLARGTAVIVYDKPGYAGIHWTLDAALPATAATYCYRVFNLNRFGRARPAAAAVTFRYDVPPTAAFGAVGAPTAGAATTFADASTDSDGSIVEWRWDFGDPSSGPANALDTRDPAAGRSPGHTYAQLGAYVVTLTVVDDGGKTATVSHTITVAAGGSG